MFLYSILKYFRSWKNRKQNQGQKMSFYYKNKEEKICGNFNRVFGQPTNAASEYGKMQLIAHSNPAIFPTFLDKYNFPRFYAHFLNKES